MLRQFLRQKYFTKVTGDRIRSLRIPNKDKRRLISLTYFLTPKKMSSQGVFTFIPLDELKQLINESVRTSFNDEVVNLFNLNKNQKEELMSLSEACDFLRVSKVTIHKWKKLKKIQSYRIGRKIYFKQKELIDALNNQIIKTK